MRLGSLRVLADDEVDLPRLLDAGDTDDKDLTAVVRRADARGEQLLVVRAIGDDGRLLARREVTLAPGADRGVAHLPMPSELRNRATAIQIEGEASAGAVLLLDERWRRRPVGVVAGQRGTAAQPLLSGAFYLERALSPFSEVRRGDLPTLLKGDIAVLALPDAAPAGNEEKAALVKWMEDGGVVLRFAGPHLAEQTDDDLLPVSLRRGGRSLGGALSWEKPAKLAPFAAGIALRRPRHSRRRDGVAPGAGGAHHRSRRQDLGAPDRRHAACHRREARQGLARAGPHDSRSGMVEPRDLRSLRRHAAPRGRAGPRSHRQQRCGIAAGRDARRLRPPAIGAGNRRNHRRRRLRRDRGIAGPPAGLLRHARCAPRPQPRRRGAALRGAGRVAARGAPADLRAAEARSISVRGCWARR